MDQVKEVPFHRLLPNEIVKEKDPLNDAPVCETRQITRICACSGLVLQDINDYLYHIYEQMIKCYY
jgi:hypothetical protein